MLMRCLSQLVALGEYSSSRMPQVNDAARLPQRQQQYKTAFELNTRAVAAAAGIGMGHPGLSRFCSLMNMPSLSVGSYNSLQKDFFQNVYNFSQKTLKESASVVRDHYISLDPDLSDCDHETVILDISVSFDGSWLTRGHTSNMGLGVVVHLITGLALDYAVLCKYCHACTLATQHCGEGFDAWYNSHKKDCDKNWDGSAAAMEAAIAEKLWKRSIETHRFRYTTLLSDGDAKTFMHLKDMNVYGDKFPIDKEECVNHVSKRLGTALRKQVTSSKAQGVTLGGAGKGRLTAAKINKLTVYYGRAVRANSDSVGNMRSAVMASFLHSISTDDDPHYSRCLEGKDSWCFFPMCKSSRGRARATYQPCWDISCQEYSQTNSADISEILFS